MKSHKVTGIMHSVERLGTSYYGNPYFRVTLDNGTSLDSYRTSIDAGISYSVENHRPRYGQTGPTVTLTLTKAGRIIDIEPRG